MVFDLIIILPGHMRKAAENNQLNKMAFHSFMIFFILVLNYTL